MKTFELFESIATIVLVLLTVYYFYVVLIKEKTKNHLTNIGICNLCLCGLFMMTNIPFVACIYFVIAFSILSYSLIIKRFLA